MLAIQDILLYNVPMNQRNKEIAEIAEFYIPMIVALFVTVWILWG